MALTVSLVLLDVVRGHIRGSLVAWLVIVPTVSLQELVLPTPVTNPAPPLVTAIAYRRHRCSSASGRFVSRLLPWIAVAVVSLISWNESFALGSSVTWFWQVALVVPGVVLAARPLLDEMRRNRAQPHFQGVEVVEVVTPLE